MLNINCPRKQINCNLWIILYVLCGVLFLLKSIQFKFCCWQLKHGTALIKTDYQPTFHILFHLLSWYLSRCFHRSFSQSPFPCTATHVVTSLCFIQQPCCDSLSLKGKIMVLTFMSIWLSHLPLCFVVYRRDESQGKIVLRWNRQNVLVLWQVFKGRLQTRRIILLITTYSKYHCVTPLVTKYSTLHPSKW